jgi:superoxide reductase
MERRDFLKTSLLVAGASVALGAERSFASPTTFPPGVIYTKDNPGRWAEKAGGHLPKVTVEGGRVTIVTPHPMTEKHFIVRHTLVAPDGTVLGEKTFTPAEARAESSFELPKGQGGTLYATSFCNLHDFWLTEFTL